MASSKRIGRKSTRYHSAAQVATRRPLAPALPQLNLGLIPRPRLLAWRSKLVAFVLFVLCAAGLYEFFVDDWFYVDHVQVQGLNILTPREVERASGALGYNIFFLEPSQVERTLAKMPEVKSAQIMLGAPNAVLVQLEERQPEVVWVKSDEVYWADVDGIAFRARSPRSDLPIVRDLDSTGLQPGKRVALAAFNAFVAARAVWQPMPKNFEWTTANGLSAIDEHGWKIILGDANDMELKITKLKALTARLVGQGARIKFIDLGKGEPFYQ